MSAPKTIFVFFIGGLGSGCITGWLLSSGRFTSFWFTKSDKFVIPTYRYYVCFSVLLLSGLAFAYVVSRTRGWIKGPLSRSTLRHVASALAIGLSAPAIFAIFTLDRDFFESPAWFFVGVIAFLCLISAACWILTSRLFYPGLLINFLTLPAAITLLFLLVRILKISGRQSEMVTYPIYDCLIAVAFGYWIVRSNAAHSRLS